MSFFRVVSFIFKFETMCYSSDFNSILVQKRKLAALEQEDGLELARRDLAVQIGCISLLELVKLLFRSIQPSLRFVIVSRSRREQAADRQTSSTLNSQKPRWSGSHSARLGDASAAPEVRLRAARFRYGCYRGTLEPCVGRLRDWDP